jgi:hypothetical protein
MCLNAPL